MHSLSLFPWGFSDIRKTWSSFGSAVSTHRTEHVHHGLDSCSPPHPPHSLSSCWVLMIWNMGLGWDRALPPYFSEYVQVSDSSFVSLPLLSSCVSPACADSTIVSVRAPGSDSHHHLHWKQQQCKNLYGGLVPTAT